MKGAAHVPGNVPFFVYERSFKWRLGCRICESRDTLKKLYTTPSYTYAKNFLQESVVLEFEDENEDPVVDSEFAPEGKKTLAIVPGAFKPPHQGHADMVQKYADKADKVLILISKPTKTGRYLRDGTEIVQSHARKIWEDVFLPQISGAEIEINTETDFASPLQAGLDYIGANGPLDPKRLARYLRS